MTAVTDASPAPPRCIADIMALAANCPPVRTAVVHPCDAASLGGAIAAADHSLIDPVLVGPEAKIRAAASAAGTRYIALCSGSGRTQPCRR